MNTRVIAARLPADLAEKLDDLAERLDRPQRWIIEKAMAAYVVVEEQRHRWTLEALADVDADRTIEHAKVELWARSLPGPKRLQTRSLQTRS